jgi:hypothetical protein
MERQITKTMAILLTVCFILSITAATVIAKEENSNRYVMPRDSKYLGKTYEQWSVKWWQWVLAIPAKDNPLNDKTGKLTNEAQSGDVWFLAGSWVGTTDLTINVPVGKALFLPVINVEGSKIEGLGNTQKEMRDYSTGIIDKVVDKEATIDGNNVNLENYRVRSTLFVFKLPFKNNVLTASGEKTPSGELVSVPPYSSPAVSEGYWILVKPLPEGTHTIHIYGKIQLSPEPFESEMTYHITVAKRWTNK